jgi:ectoine hydroxylase-related dioxygenase (phytanoyl-CoA dioxygenase family)
MSYALERDGFEFARGFVAEAQRSVLLAALGDPDRAGSRGLLALPEVRAFARSEAVMSLVSACLGPDAQPVRAIFFDKTLASNWLVPWHQDVTIAVASKAETPGFGPWSVKDGIPHVQPPESLLASVMALRLHFDECTASNGALRVIAGSHRSGRLGAEQVLAAKAAFEEVVCEATAGDVLLMRPLLLHASSKSVADRRRRILHIEYCSEQLPQGMAWHEAA